MLPYLTIQSLAADHHRSLLAEAANDRLADQALRHRRGRPVATGRRSLWSWTRGLSAPRPATGGSAA